MGKNAAAEYGGEPSGARAPPKGRAKRRPQPRPPLRRSAAFRARRTPCRAAFCSPLLRPAAPAAPPLSAPGVHPVVPFFVHRFCAPPGAPFLKGRHKFALWNDTIAIRLKNRAPPLFCSPLLRTAGRKKARPAGAPLRGGKSPRAAPRFCGRLLEKNKRGKTPHPNSWTEPSAPAANRAERERRQTARAAPRFCGRLLEKTSTAKPRTRIVGQRQAPRRRTERSESAAHSRARRSAAFRARRTPYRAVFCSPLLRTAGRKKARPAGRAFSERSSQICALE